MNPCLNCGNDVGDQNPPNPSHCRNCPPSRCEDCGEMCEWHVGGRLCSCWTDVRDLPLAEARALFAACPDVECGEPALSFDPERAQP